MGTNDGPTRITTKKSIEKAYALLDSLRPKEKAPRKKFTTPPVVLTPEAQAKKRKQLVWAVKKHRLNKTLIIDTVQKRVRLPWQEFPVMEQLRYAMGRHDWPTVIRLFPYCGVNHTNFQPIRFTYVFLLCLSRHETEFQHFLETCIGPGAAEGATLQRLMTLQQRQNYT